ncbi:MAG: alpha-amylase family glycosyl hydrolase [Bacteroidales bacterium]|nr:alpha-amylase family glycosyl hydrolase [Bacteroidales bacterium]MDD4602963.1 alpha-amylase family glycosyl hydrolase [Bacteroidales bacterium]
MNSWRQYPVIYEINTWVWLRELTIKTGIEVTLSNVPENILDDLSGLSIDAVWLMGVWERSPRGKKISNQNEGNLRDFRQALHDFTLDDNIGSPYCVKRYMVDEHLGGTVGLSIFREKLASRGIKLILDFVPNHLAHDHPWVSESPDFFIQGNFDDLQKDPATFVAIGNAIFACGKDPFYQAWQDVVQMNAFHPDLRKAILETILQIANQCDGIRCDMAMLVMNDIFEKTWQQKAGSKPMLDYWEEIIPATKRHHEGFLFIAEAYWDMEWNLQQQGFDYCYDKRLYDRLESRNPATILQHISAPLDFQSKLLRFIENHDEPRAAAIFKPFTEKALAVAFSTLPGARLFHEGQLEGRKVKLPVFLCRRSPEPVNFALQSFYCKLLSEISLPVFHQGCWSLFQTSGWVDNHTFSYLLSWGWKGEGTSYLIIINMSEKDSQGKVRIDWQDLRGSNWQLDDPFSGQSYLREGSELLNPGLYVSLEPWSFHFFRVTAP